MPTNDSSARASVSTELSLIETILIDRIIRRHGRDHFVIGVYLHHQLQKTPLTLLSPTELFFRTRQPRYLTGNSYSSVRGESDFEILHRYSDFIKLRSSLSVIVNGVHHKTPADHNLCGQLRDLLNHDWKRPSKGLALFSSTKAQMEHLASFVHMLVGVVVNATMEAQHHRQSGSCSAALQAALVLEDFLRKPKQAPSLGII